MSPTTLAGPAFVVDPSFAEAVAWRALVGGARAAEEMTAYRARCEPIYAIADAAARDAAFSRLALNEIERLDLVGPIRAAITERPVVAELVRTVLVGEARSRTDEGITWEPGGAHLGIRLDAARFADPEDLLGWARHALGHAEDTIDPAFGFRPGWEDGPTGRLAPTVQARLHRFWDVSIDARLAAAGRLLEPEAADRHVADLAADLPGVGSAAVDAVFGFLWERPRPAFDALLGWAAEPRRLVALAAPDEPAAPRPDRCPLCRFPGDDIVPPEAAIAARVVAEYPDWRPADGLCGRCTDRYRFAGRLGGAA